MKEKQLDELKTKKKLLVLSEELFKRIEIQAKKESRSTASLIRWAIINYLEKDE